MTTPRPGRHAESWRAADLEGDSSWLFELSAEQQEELVLAAEKSLRDGEAIAEISRESFELPRLGPVLERCRDDLMHGRGFCVLRAPELSARSREEVMRAFFGVGAYLGEARPQNARGHLIGHVYDLKEDPKDPSTRVYRTAARQRFHIDSCDLVGLLCLRKSVSGGASMLCSSIAVIEEIAATRPDLAAVLREPFVYDRKDEIPAGKGPCYEIAIVHEREGKTSVFFARDFIEAAQSRFPEVPRLSVAQVEALDLIERLAESDEFRLEVEFEPGDMQFVHNHVILHARGGYEDGAGPGQQRHLLRLWLSAHDPRPLPEVFSERYGPMRPGRPRGGIEVPGVRWQVPLFPE